MSTNKIKNYQQHTIIFADRNSITPNENDLHIKQLWIDIYNKNLNEGAVQSNGTILWDCPCLGTQAIGPCSTQFRAAFSCYQSSTKEPKGIQSVVVVVVVLSLFSNVLYSSGSECMDEFMKMQKCFAQYPKLYDNNNHSSKTTDDVESNITLMNHPEARRYQMKKKNK